MRRLTVLMLLGGMAMLAVCVIYSGFYTLEKNEIAVVVEYEPVEVIGELLDKLRGGRLDEFRADLIAIIHEQHSGGKVRIVGFDDPAFLTLPAPFGKLHWHTPPPFGKHHTISLTPHDYYLNNPLILRLTEDQEGRALTYYALTPDADGDPLTNDPGFRLISAHDVFEIQFSPEEEFTVMKLSVDGRFKITDLERYALWLKDSHGRMDKLIGDYGFFGEIVWGPYGDELIEVYLSELLDFYVWQIRYPILFEGEQEKNPELSTTAIESLMADFIIENPETLTEGFVDSLSSPEFVEITGIELERGVGIEVSEEISTEIFEGTI